MKTSQNTTARKVLAAAIGIIGLTAMAVSGASVLDDDMHWKSGPTSVVADGETCTGPACDDDMHW